MKSELILRNAKHISALVSLAKRRWCLCALALAVGSTAAQAQTYTVLYSFTGGTNGDGSTPLGGLVRDSAGNLYGTTFYGGNLVDQSGGGTVFKLDTSGNETVLHNFTGGTDGENPQGDLLRDAKVDLYGTTVNGGDLTCQCGTVFELDALGNETVLHRFTGGADGSHPYSGVIRDAGGNLYGTTRDGGASGLGTVFKVTSAGKETILHSFTTSDGIYPQSRLIRDSAGNLYGTTTSGGAHNSGTVITLDGTGKRIRLFSFQPWNGSPNSPLVRDSAGNLYGSTCGGGTLDYGTAFEIVNSTNKRSQLFSFGTTEGACPGGHIAMDSAGNLYGTTSLGYHAFGTVWELNISSGVETVLYAFDAGDPAEGQAPVAGVIRDTAGNLYGTASSGGDLSCGSGLGCGVVFEVTP